MGKRLTIEQRNEARTMAKQGATASQIGKQFGIHATSAQYYIETMDKATGAATAEKATYAGNDKVFVVVTTTKNLAATLSNLS